MKSSDQSLIAIFYRLDLIDSESMAQEVKRREKGDEVVQIAVETAIT